MSLPSAMLLRIKVELISSSGVSTAFTCLGRLSLWIGYPGRGYTKIGYLDRISSGDFHLSNAAQLSAPIMSMNSLSG